MAKDNSQTGGNQLPVKKVPGTPVKLKKISALSKDAAEFLAKMDKKKAGPGEIANALEQWLNNE